MSNKKFSFKFEIKEPFVVYPQGVGRGCKGHSPQQHTLSLSNHEWPFDKLRANGLVDVR